MDVSVYSMDKLIAETRRLAAEYRRATGKPLAVGGEIARYDAARLLNLELVPASEGSGHDAIGRGSRQGLRIQVKGRAIFDEERRGQRLGQIRTSADWDLLLLVLMDENFETYEIYEAERDEVMEALEGAAATKRSKRGPLSVARIRNLGRLVWSRANGVEDDGYWDNAAAL